MISKMETLTVISSLLMIGIKEYICQKSYWEMLTMVSNPFPLRAEKVYAAQFLFGGNPYDSTFFAYLPRYVKIPTRKGLVLSPNL